MSGRDDAEKALLVQRHQLDQAGARVGELGRTMDEVERTQAETNARLAQLAARLAELRGDETRTAAADAIPSPQWLELDADEVAAVDAGLPQFRPLPVVEYADPQAYRREVDGYLRTWELDTNRDPMLQLLGPSGMREVQREFRFDFGDLRWTTWDHAAVGTSVLMASLVDLFAVRLPREADAKQRALWDGRLYKGSPITAWLEGRAAHMAAVSEGAAADSPLWAWLGQARQWAEAYAAVPYDASNQSQLKSYGQKIPGLNPHLHRLMSPSHDPGLAFVLGVVEVLAGSCTLIDDLGRVHVVSRPEKADHDLFRALTKPIVHLFSDMGKTSVPPPFFSLLQLYRGETVALREGGPKVNGANLARWMYKHGYTTNHMVTMSLVPMIIETMLRVWFLLAHFDELYERPAAPHLKVKLNSMRATAHLLTSSAGFLKMHLYGWNPLAFNWSQALATTQSFYAWARSRVEREEAIRETLTDNWRALCVQAGLGR